MAARHSTPSARAFCITVILGIGLLATSGCGTPPPPPKPLPPAPTAAARPLAGPPVLALVPARFADLPGWEADNHQEGLAALRQSCPKLASRPAAEPMGSDALFGRVSHWQQLCAAAFLVTEDDRAARTFIERWFIPYRAVDRGDDQGLFTGYYEPIIRGSWRRTSPRAVPVYRAPPEMAAAAAMNDRAVPMPTRAQIDAGALAGRGLELLWIDDPVDAFFLHIQGSGRVQMPDGQLVRVGYAGKNGHPYFPIGAELVRRGEVPQEQMSMQAIRIWLTGHPDEARRLMQMNRSYVFFRLVDGDGPIGAQGVALVPGRSVAVDPAFVPYGVPIWLDTTDPSRDGQPLRRLLVAQDTGGAIRGAIRGDVFWGSGDLAGFIAGQMRQPGRWFLLLPRAAIATS